MSHENSLPPLPLPQGITSSYVPTVDLNYHVLLAGPLSAPLILLLHGFPELAFSWRKLMLPLASLGFRVVAYDQRGYGRTTGWDTSSFEKVNMRQFSMTRIIADAVRLVRTLGYENVHCLVGHDFGAVAAAWCALTRPDFFKSVVLMSHPYKGAPTLRLEPPPDIPLSDHIHDDLASLDSPRKAYKWYYSTSTAAADMDLPAPQLSRFLRSYFHLKSADWPHNDPHPLEAWNAKALAKMPGYYVMPLKANMPETCEEAIRGSSFADISGDGERWLDKQALEVYVAEYGRVGFQGSLNWYRSFTDEASTRELEAYAGKLLSVPLLFIAGKQDWGIYQEPGAFEKMEEKCEKNMFRGAVIVEGAGHWVQQEQPGATFNHIESFLKELSI